MSEAGSAQLVEDGSRLSIRGDWTLEHVARLATLCANLRGRIAADSRIDARAIGRIDTAGASFLLDLAGADLARIDVDRASTRKLIAAVSRAENAPPAK